MSLAGKTLFITGASRGIGLAIGLRAARDGANVVVAAKTVEPHPKLPGTIHSAAAEIETAGGSALAVACDVRSEEQIGAAVSAAIERFGGIDVVVNNASAIRLGGTAQIDTKAFDLMQAIGPRATYLVTRAALPHLLASAQAGRNPHVLTLSPPIALGSQWLGAAPAYTLKKYGMTLLTLGFAAEFRPHGIAANALWPKTTIATAAVQNLLGGEAMIRASRTPAIVADAAHRILTGTRSGECLIDEDVLREAGTDDFAGYAVAPGTPLAEDIFLD
ncbi:MAG TPA: NAD(P)-dependent oxidoreductase [Candidatus Limnocylindria bacterium]|jgi:citronellol/citronellal dehydrogenase|nr:NAD(P)-dependent oxidoreductase [Candidatus Limnocylindria bacterium]